MATFSQKVEKSIEGVEFLTKWVERGAIAHAELNVPCLTDKGCIMGTPL